MMAVLVIIVPAFVLAGCIGLPDDGEDGAQVDGVTLIIDFETFEPFTHAGSDATWSPDGRGNWTLVKEARAEGGTRYVVLNVTASTVYEALVNGSAVADFDIEAHRESMGAFVDSIDGLENGADGHHWSYYLNGEYGIVASDKAYVSDGDEVRWVYMGNPFG
jgi:hypothetical protein